MLLALSSKAERVAHPIPTATACPLFLEVCMMIADTSDQQPTP